MSYDTTNKTVDWRQEVTIILKHIYLCPWLFNTSVFTKKHILCDKRKRKVFPDFLRNIIQELQASAHQFRKSHY